MKLTVIGTGYVGLVTGACFSETGNDVTCVDIDAGKIDRLNQGIIPIYEPGLTELVTRNAKANRLHFSTDTRSAVVGADIVFLAVNTPTDPVTHNADLTALFKATEAALSGLTGPCLLVTKSTVPVGTGKKLSALFKNASPHPWELVSNPEFLKEGDAINDFMKPDRVVVGCVGERAKELMLRLYEPFVRTGNPVVVTDVETSEMIKYASNAFLAAKISFMNELSGLCTATGADVDVVRRGMGHDKRIGQLFMFPGVGYGGACFPKDVKALAALGREVGVQVQLLDAIEAVNERQKLLFPREIVKRFGESLSGLTFAIWGLAFKPKTDDIREAPAVVLITELLKRGATVRVTDPVAMENVKAIFGSKLSYFDDAYATAEGADAVCLMTEWNDFRQPDFVRLSKAVRARHLFDGRNIYDPKVVASFGFSYTGVGRQARPS